jgi:hypothetical protein
VRTDGLSEARSSKCRPVSVPLVRSPSTVPSKQSSPPAGPARGPTVDHVVGDADRLGLVLDDQDGVALVPQAQQQVVHALDVVRVQPDRRLVEDVRDVGERRPEVADHLGALRLTARQRAGRPVEAEVAEADLDEGVERLDQRRQQRRDRRLLQRAHPVGEVADLHRAGVGDADACDLRGPRALVEAGPAAVRARGEGDRALDEGADVRLQAVDVLRQHRLLDLRDESLVGEVDALDLHLAGLAVQELVALLRGELRDRHVERDHGAEIRPNQPSGV